MTNSTQISLDRSVQISIVEPSYHALQFPISPISKVEKLRLVVLRGEFIVFVNVGIRKTNHSRTSVCFGRRVVRSFPSSLLIWESLDGAMDWRRVKRK